LDLQAVTDNGSITDNNILFSTLIMHLLYHLLALCCSLYFLQIL
jgi:hypothetical protein